MEKFEKLLTTLINFIKQHTSVCVSITTIFSYFITFVMTNLKVIFLNNHFDFFNVSTSYIETRTVFDIHFYFFVIITVIIVLAILFLKFKIFEAITDECLKMTNTLLYYCFSIFITFPIFLSFLLIFKNNLNNGIFSFITRYWFLPFIYVFVFFIFVFVYLGKNDITNKLKYIRFLSLHFIKHTFVIIFFNIIFFVLVLLFIPILFQKNEYKTATDSNILYLIFSFFVFFVMLDYVFYIFTRRNKTLNLSSNKFFISKKNLYNFVKKYVFVNLTDILTIKKCVIENNRYFFNSNSNSVRMKIQGVYKFNIKMSKIVRIGINFNSKRNSSSLSTLTIASFIAGVILYAVGIIQVRNIPAYSYEIIKFENKQFLSVYTTNNMLILKEILSVNKENGTLTISKNHMVVSATLPNVYRIKTIIINYKDITISD